MGGWVSGVTSVRYAGGPSLRNEARLLGKQAMRSLGSGVRSSLGLGSSPVFQGPVDASSSEHWNSVPLLVEQLVLSLDGGRSALGVPPQAHVSRATVLRHARQSDTMQLVALWSFLPAGSDID